MVRHSYTAGLFQPVSGLRDVIEIYVGSAERYRREPWIRTGQCRPIN